MKFHTDLEQSKKLAGILQTESADMYWMHVQREGFNDWWKVETIQGAFKPRSMNIPCWSLGALLSLLPDDTSIMVGTLKNGERYFSCDSYQYGTPAYNSPIDACVDMICKLKEMEVKK